MSDSNNLNNLPAKQPKKSNLGGRPTKLTPLVHQTIVTAIRAGNYANVSAGYAGISDRTYHGWITRGRKEESGIYHEFFQAVKAAEHEAEVRAVAMVQSAMPDNWTAAMTYLERKFPNRWGRRSRIEHSSPSGGPIQVEVAPIPLDKLSAETKRRIIEELSTADGGSGVAGGGEALGAVNDPLVIDVEPMRQLAEG